MKKKEFYCIDTPFLFDRLDVKDTPGQFDIFTVYDDFVYFQSEVTVNNQYDNNSIIRLWIRVSFEDFVELIKKRELETFKIHGDYKFILPTMSSVETGKCEVLFSLNEARQFPEARPMDSKSILGDIYHNGFSKENYVPPLFEGLKKK